MKELLLFGRHITCKNGDIFDNLGIGINDILTVIGHFSTL